MTADRSVCMTSTFVVSCDDIRHAAFIIPQKHASCAVCDACATSDTRASCNARRCSGKRDVSDSLRHMQNFCEVRQFALTKDLQS